MLPRTNLRSVLGQNSRFFLRHDIQCSLRTLYHYKLVSSICKQARWTTFSIVIDHPRKQVRVILPNVTQKKNHVLILMLAFICCMFKWTGMYQTVITHPFRTSNFICSWTHPPLLFSGLRPLFLLFVSLCSWPFLLNLKKGAWRLVSKGSWPISSYPDLMFGQ